MSYYCECGEVATCFADMRGDPLPFPLCAECYAEQMAMDWDEDYWTDEEWAAYNGELSDPDAFILVEGP